MMETPVKDLGSEHAGRAGVVLSVCRALTEDSLPAWDLFGKHLDLDVRHGHGSDDKSKCTVAHRLKRSPNCSVVWCVAHMKPEVAVNMTN